MVGIISNRVLVCIGTPIVIWILSLIWVCLLLTFGSHCLVLMSTCLTRSDLLLEVSVRLLAFGLVLALNALPPCSQNGFILKVLVILSFFITYNFASFCAIIYERCKNLKAFIWNFQLQSSTAIIISIVWFLLILNFRHGTQIQL